MQADIESLPVRPALTEDGSLEPYVRHLAAANQLSIVRVLGAQPSPHYWDRLPPELCDRLAALGGQPPETLRASTLEGHYAGTVFRDWLLGRRLFLEPAWCPRCGRTFDPEARLRALVTCVRCDLLLTDAGGYAEDTIDTRLVADQTELRDLLKRRPSPAEATRLARLRTLVAALAGALSEEWPPLAEGESAHRRSAAIESELTKVGLGGQSRPVTTAVLLRLSWEASKADSTTTQILDEIEGRALRLPSSMRDRAASVRGDHSLSIADPLGWTTHLPTLSPEQIPHAFTLDIDAILPPENEVLLRRAYSMLIVHGLQARESGEATSIIEATRVLGKKLQPRDAPVQLAQRLCRQPAARANALVMAEAIFDEGPIDYYRRRRELRNQRDVPKRLLRALPRQVQDWSDASAFAAAWIWLDATRGCLVGGPHSGLGSGAVKRFHDQLGPEGRMTLRAHWLDEIGQTERMLDIASPKTPLTAASPHRSTKPA